MRATRGVEIRFVHQPQARRGPSGSDSVSKCVVGMRKKGLGGSKRGLEYTLYGRAGALLRMAKARRRCGLAARGGTG